MTIDERLENIARSLDTLTKIHLDDDREYRERFQKLTESQERLAVAEERLAVAQEQNTREIRALQILVQQDGEHIRALARIAELHPQRLNGLEEQ